MITTLTAFFTDCIIGDPKSRFHPVAVMGAAISALERFFYGDANSRYSRFFFGFLLTAVMLSAVFDLFYALVWALDTYTEPSFSAVIQGILLSFFICPRALARAGGGVRNSLLRHRLTEARAKLALIVGRDTAQLTERETARAAVETVAENTIDGIVSPLFFFALGGLPLAAVYRAVNTLDSMIGYRNERYLYFGRVAARTDDVFNLIPARLTGLLLVFSAALLGFSYRNAWKMMLRDALKHPSPNGGYAEAAVAGALRIRLGGFNSYFGKQSFRAYMGDEQQPIGTRQIAQTVQLMYMTTLLAVLLTALCRAFL
ncbi:adenosylcobinamide-phosphate synthase CbiB [Megasphaera vaginalis (ex Srinivasan et al. 2021)]|uniref:Cobalamin biosynthesis protein CobD n=1 Tax=Megasphaera vaginalis (ex Srinivasan et al. 2021) TaxID=1111454 RepID=U7UN53_9FIRM|nr:adenosylcobinamide-phosphate synthase CbiB [Megasphaera vaginalis (ex Srinivasan et al. 2021)]ERT60740.1 cobalamin biosynthesis protein CobD [Megasphaera vaginalis (ex Srinivasan et al. 2021)]